MIYCLCSNKTTIRLIIFKGINSNIKQWLYSILKYEWSHFFVPVCGENGDYGRKIGKIIPYYGNTMDCACVELRTFAA